MYQLRMNHQSHILINGTTSTAPLQYYVGNNTQNTNGSDSQNQNVHVQLVKEGQAHQRYIINRQYQNTSSVQIIPHCSENSVELYWLIVEIESNNEVNSYSLVESKNVVGLPPLKSLSTGKMITIIANGMHRRATVVLASDDKDFIFNEYSQINKIAEHNLNLKLRDNHVRKRRRISGSDSTRRDNDDDSSTSVWSSASQSMNAERVMSPSVHVQQKTRSDQRFIPPMMFDQGTQADLRPKADGLQDKFYELQKLIDLNEQMLNEQKLLKKEANVSRMLVESFAEEFKALRKSIQVIESKVETIVNDRGQMTAIASNDSQTETQDGAGSANASLSANESNLEYTLEEIEADDSGRSTSRMSYHDQTSMMSNSSVDGSTKKEIFRRSNSSSNFSLNSSSSMPTTSSNNLIEEWADIEGDMKIGVNETTVPVHVLRSIDWKNYKTATRKLLITLFSRETLATRSLTGRPSPAFHDRNKPVKGKLDQLVINDIIQIITRKCGVQDSQLFKVLTVEDLSAFVYDALDGRMARKCHLKRLETIS
ncbi:CLUMA_CG007319, isoform A [Clunio marinus]|uniref:CLUMA_CG007319, isoform A n=1 Tax=Clunio marinus TaxID=568069 RepID=A0A1J1I0B2_9DIPT|nr:CLUMA_CG007319, isoform A [Clunio marinus]